MQVLSLVRELSTCKVWRGQKIKKCPNLLLITTHNPQVGRHGRPHYKAASEDPPPDRRTRASRPLVPAATPTGTLHVVCPGLHLHRAFLRLLACGHAENLEVRGPKTWRKGSGLGVGGCGGERPGSPRGSPRCARRSRSGVFATRLRPGPALSHGSPRASESPPPWPQPGPGPSRAGKAESAGKAVGRVSTS